jgi:tetratricopeptide (TPR) repeat protein
MKRSRPSVIPRPLSCTSSLAFVERTRGREYPDLAPQYNNLATSLQDQGRYWEAEPLYWRAIEIGEKTLGRDHPVVAVWYSNLAILLKAEGKYAEAEPLLRWATEIGEKIQDSLRNQIAAVEAEKRALEAEGKGVAERLTNLQTSYDGLVQKLAEANAALQAFAPLISKDAFEQAHAMLSRGDVLGAEGKFVEIANTVAKIREQADVVEAQAIFHAGELAEQRIDSTKELSEARIIPTLRGLTTISPYRSRPRASMPRLSRATQERQRHLQCCIPAAVQTMRRMRTTIKR